jgi:6-methylsalicylate decarboxylase
MPGVSERVGDMNAAFASFYYDTVLSAGVLTISALMQVARPDHVLFRTDFPMAPVPAITKFGQELEKLSVAGFSLRMSIDAMLHSCSAATHEFLR